MHYGRCRNKRGNTSHSQESLTCTQYKDEFTKTILLRRFEICLINVIKLRVACVWMIYIMLLDDLIVWKPKQFPPSVWSVSIRKWRWWHANEWNLDWNAQCENVFGIKCSEEFHKIKWFIHFEYSPLKRSIAYSEDLFGFCFVTFFQRVGWERVKKAIGLRSSQSRLISWNRMFWTELKMWYEFESWKWKPFPHD